MGDKLLANRDVAIHALSVEWSIVITSSYRQPSTGMHFTVSPAQQLNPLLQQWSAHRKNSKTKSVAGDVSRQRKTM
jgi:hypothetical protein